MISANAQSASLSPKQPPSSPTITILPPGYANGYMASSYDELAPDIDYDEQ